MISMGDGRWREDLKAAAVVGGVLLLVAAAAAVWVRWGAGL
jgi:hypothetical protein